MTLCPSRINQESNPNLHAVTAKMGSAVSSVMDENMKKSQEFMGESQKAMLKRQVST